VGVDIKGNMIESAKNWAERKGMAGKTDSKDADAQDLPFDEGSFDILICESVNIFVPDKVKAFTEYKRVVKPGGVVGLNEPVLTKTAPANAGELLADFVGHDILPVSYWMDLLEETGFIDIILREYPVEMREESRTRWISLSLEILSDCWGIC